MLKVLAKTSVFFVLFPYLVMFPTESDTQPNALIFNLLFILCFIFIYNFRAKFSYITLVFFGIFLYSIAGPWIMNSISLRGIAPYASLVIFSLSSYWIFQKDLFSIKVFKFAVWGWFFVGLIQSIFNSNFGYILLPRVLTTASRGVVSLAPEPSHYGIMCLFMIIAIDMLSLERVFDKKSALKYRILLLFQLVCLSQSFTAIFLYLLYIATCSLLRFNLVRFLKLLIYSGIAFLIFFLVIELYGTENSRLSQLLLTFLSNPVMILFDKSALQRTADIYMSLYGFFHSLPLAFGHGTMSYQNYVIEHLDKLPKRYLGVSSDRIMSGYGAALFELGYIGMLIPILTFFSFWKNRSVKMKGIGLFLLISMFSAIPLSFPIYSFLIGLSEFSRLRDPTPSLIKA